MIRLFAIIWHYIDVLCFLAALGFIVWGCFLLNFIAGIFSIAASLILIGLGTELIAQQKGGGS